MTVMESVLESVLVNFQAITINSKKVLADSMTESVFSFKQGEVCF